MNFCLCFQVVAIIYDGLVSDTFTVDRRESKIFLNSLALAWLMGFVFCSYGEI